MQLEKKFCHEFCTPHCKFARLRSVFIKLKQFHPNYYTDNDLKEPTTRDKVNREKVNIVYTTIWRLGLVVIGASISKPLPSIPNVTFVCVYTYITCVCVCVCVCHGSARYLLLTLMFLTV